MQRNFNFTAQTLLELIGIDGAKKAITDAKRLNCKNIAYAGTTYCSIRELEQLIKCTSTTQDTNMNNEDELNQAIATCFNAIHVRLGQQMTANDVKDVFRIKKMIGESRYESSMLDEEKNIPYAILEASKER